ncbi:MAG: histidinol phosphate phosphatase [Alphaproteobacteria bacterium GM202ARS2]|nr:histidinol phosphate phosphatase [Alphaproteobacteria bacterium GM202ARS2]
MAAHANPPPPPSPPSPRTPRAPPTSPAPLQQAHIDCACTLAQKGRDLLRQQFRQTHIINVKADATLVTDIDKRIETLWRDTIARTFPDHGIIGEEFPPVREDAPWLWSLDPLDGTSAFVSGSPLYGLLVGLCYHETPCYGIIASPQQNEQWQGGPHQPTTWQNKPCRTRQQNSLNQALLYATTPDMFSPQQYALFQRLSGQCLATRYGVDCYAYGLLASGFIDIVAEASMKPADYLALAPVIQGAGGTITDWLGKPLSRHSDGSVLACSTHTLHQHVLNLWHG